MSDVQNYVGIWTSPDGVRQFEIQSTGIVKFIKAARPVSRFTCGRATINQSRGCLQFTLKFPRDDSNPTGRAMWFVHIDHCVEQAFDVPMPSHPSLESDGMSTKPVKFQFTGHSSKIQGKVERTWSWYSSDPSLLPGLIASDPQTLQKLCKLVPIPTLHEVVEYDCFGNTSWTYISWRMQEFIFAVCDGVSKQITWVGHQTGKALPPLEALQGGTGVCLEFANTAASVLLAHSKRVQADVPRTVGHRRWSGYNSIQVGNEDVAVVIGLKDAKKKDSVHAWIRYGNMHFEPQNGGLITEHKEKYLIWYEYTCEEFHNCGQVSDSEVGSLLRKFVMNGGGQTNLQISTRPAVPNCFSLCSEPSPGYYAHIVAMHRLKLMHLLNLPVDAICHIGSTAVAGMLGTPVVDLVAALPTQLTSKQRRGLETNGYSFCGIAPHKVEDSERHEWFSFSNGKDDEVVLHVVREGDKWAKAAVGMVWYLKKSDEARREYQKVKETAMQAANRTGGGMSAYKRDKEVATVKLRDVALR